MCRHPAGWLVIVGAAVAVIAFGCGPKIKDSAGGESASGSGFESDGPGDSGADSPSGTDSPSDGESGSGDGSQGSEGACAQDEFEPNNSFAEAECLDGSIQGRRRELCGPGDVDFYRIELSDEVDPEGNPQEYERLEVDITQWVVNPSWFSEDTPLIQITIYDGAFNELATGANGGSAPSVAHLDQGVYFAEIRFSPDVQGTVESASYEFVAGTPRAREWCD